MTTNKTLLLLAAVMLLAAVHAQCDWNDKTNALKTATGCAASQYCATKAGRKVTTYDQWTYQCSTVADCLCHAVTKKIVSEACTASADCSVGSCFQGLNATTSTNRGLEATAGNPGTCLLNAAATGCRKDADCRVPIDTRKASHKMLCLHDSGIGVDDTNSHYLCRDFATCTCTELVVPVAVSSDNLAVLDTTACTANGNCFGTATQCKDKNGIAFGETGVGALKCRMVNPTPGCYANDHCVSQLCIVGTSPAIDNSVSATTEAPDGPSGQCVATGATDGVCAFHGAADQHPTGCSTAEDRCITKAGGLIIPDKATYQKSQCNENPFRCKCTARAATTDKTAGAMWMDAGGRLASVVCVSALGYDVSTDTIIGTPGYAVTRAGIGAGMAISDAICPDDEYCVCLIPDNEECTSSRQCLPGSSCYLHLKTADQGALLGICVHEKEARDSEVLDKIEQFDSVTLINKMDDVETNVKANTTAKTDALGTSLKGADNGSLTTLQAAVATDIAAVKSDVTAVNAKMALETTAQKLKKDVSDTEDKVGGYGIAAVVLVAIILVAGVVLSFSAAGKGTKLRSSSSRQRGRRQEESEGESST